MLKMFRNEIKKWSTFLWVVLLSMAFASLSVLVFRPSSPSKRKIASVDSMPIYLSDYQHELAQIRSKIEMMKNYAQAQGISPEWFLSLSGLDHPETVAFDEVVSSKLVDKIQQDLDLVLNEKYFLSQLSKSIPSQLLDSSGQINEKRYKEYLSHLYISIPEFEQKREDDIKRGMVKEFIKYSVYTPKYLLKDLYLQKNQKKSFEILNIPFDKFLSEAKEQKVSDKELKDFYAANSELYRIAEKKRATYWVLSADDYEKNVNIDESAINSFYKKNKTELFRIAPEVNVRKILVKDKTKAEELYKNLKDNPTKFAEIAKESSLDDETAPRGGEIDFFKRGTYDDVEFEKAAFRLKNADEISPIVKTDKGFEIIKLIERKAASYKPLDNVRDEIVKTLKSKRAFNSMRADLATVTYKARSDKSAIGKFAKEKGLKEKRTDWLTKKDETGEGIVPQLALKLFSKQKNKFGYFLDKDDCVLFVETGKEKSSIPSFEKVSKNVLKNYIDTQAEGNAEKFVNQLQKELLTNNITLKKARSKYNLQLIISGLINKSSSIPGIDVSGLVSKAFELSDTSQILKFEEKNNYYLIQLERVDKFDDKEFAEKLNELLSAEEETQKTLSLKAFIDSLLRNAKIEKNEDFLNLG